MGTRRLAGRVGKPPLPPNLACSERWNRRWGAELTPVPHAVSQEEEKNRAKIAETGCSIFNISVLATLWEDRIHASRDRSQTTGQLRAGVGNRGIHPSLPTCYLPPTTSSQVQQRGTRERMTGHPRRHHRPGANLSWPCNGLHRLHEQRCSQRFRRRRPGPGGGSPATDAIWD